MSLECLTLRVMDLPIRSRRAINASSRTTKASPTASSCLSNLWELHTGRSCSSPRTLIAAVVEQVRSHDGWGLPSKQIDGYYLLQPMQMDLRIKIRSRCLWDLTGLWKAIGLHLTEVYALQMHQRQEICKEGLPLPRLTLLAPTITFYQLLK